jgi:hypothetical protein
MVDLWAVIQPQSQVCDHSAAPPVSASPLPLWRPPPARHREPSPAPPASTNATCVACFARTSRTTTLRGLTRVSITTARAGARCSRARPGISSPCPKSAGFITATSARPDRPRSPPARHLRDHLPRQGCHASIPSSGAAASLGARVSSRANALGAENERFASLITFLTRTTACFAWVGHRFGTDHGERLRQSASQGSGTRR